MTSEAESAAAARNETYKHLEDPLRLSGLTIVQIATVCAAGLVAIVFGLYISPLPTGVTMGPDRSEVAYHGCGPGTSVNARMPGRPRRGVHRRLRESDTERLNAPLTFDVIRDGP